MIQAVVFDFDGLVFDSETHEYQVVSEIFREHGAELPLEVWGQCVGREPGFFDAYAYLEERLGRPVDRESLRTLRHERFFQRIAEQGPLPGIPQALETAHELGLRVGLASSSPRVWVLPQLARLALLPYFHAVRTADDVSRVKPDPELYLNVCEALGVLPEHAVAFEDSPNGALAARRAGMRCVVVPNSVTGTLEFGEHDMRLDTLHGVGLAEMLEELVEGSAKVRKAESARVNQPQGGTP